MAIYSDVMDSFEFRDDVLHGRVSGNWLQGRTVYGGLTAALCHHACLMAHPELPPLRSVLLSFIGPAEGDLTVKTEILRQGKSVTTMNADLYGDKGLAVRAMFAFGAARQSMFSTHFIPAPDVPGPDDAEMFFPPNAGPGFAQNFDVRLARGGAPISASKEHDHFLWVRHHDRTAQSMTALIALADMPPPAMMPMFPQFAPISSMNWGMNFFTDHPATDDGWWLLESKAENAAEGYSSQDMFIWNRAGEPVVAGRQNVAIFI